MRRTFQITVLFIAFIPCVLGALSLVHGAARLVPEDLITTELDGQVRFWGIRSMLPFFLSIWIVANLEKAFAVLVIVLGATAAGGVARIVSALIYGAPEPALIGIIVFELAVLLFIPWYQRIVQTRDDPPPTEQTP